MPLDPSLSLQVKTPEFVRPEQLLSLQNLARQGQMQQMQMAEQQRAQQERNALLGILRDPSAFDPVTNTPNEEAIRKVFAIKPEVGQKFSADRMIALSKLGEQGAKQLEAVRKADEAAAAAYLQSRANMPEGDALRLATEARMGVLDEYDRAGLRKLWGIDDQKWQTIRGMPFSPATAARFQKAPEAFTLAPGATRYGPDAKPIVSAPATDKGVWSEPFNMNGAMVQQNSVTKEIRTAVGRPQVTQNIITPPSKVFENENKLRDDYTTASRSFSGIRDAYNTVSAALSGPITAVSTLAGATKFMKMIDPESVVRESELQMALRASGMLDRFMNLHNTVLKGQVLTPTQAVEIKNIAKTLYDAAEKQQARTDKHFKDLATEYGLSPNRVVRDQSSVARDEQRGDLRGAVEGAGWKYEPDKYDYRIGPDGTPQRKAKNG